MLQFFMTLLVYAALFGLSFQAGLQLEGYGVFIWIHLAIHCILFVLVVFLAFSTAMTDPGILRKVRLDRFDVEADVLVPRFHPLGSFCRMC